jgi:hypothetical protein
MTTDAAGLAHRFAACCGWEVREEGGVVSTRPRAGGEWIPLLGWGGFGTVVAEMARRGADWQAGSYNEGTVVRFWPHDSDTWSRASDRDPCIAALRAALPLLQRDRDPHG